MGPGTSTGEKFWWTCHKTQDIDYKRKADVRIMSVRQFLCFLFFLSFCLDDMEMGRRIGLVRKERKIVSKLLACRIRDPNQYLMIHSHYHSNTHFSTNRPINFIICRFFQFIHAFVTVVCPRTWLPALVLAFFQWHKYRKATWKENCWSIIRFILWIRKSSSQLLRACSEDGTEPSHNMIRQQKSRIAFSACCHSLILHETLQN